VAEPFSKDFQDTTHLANAGLLSINDVAVLGEAEDQTAKLVSGHSPRKRNAGTGAALNYLSRTVDVVVMPVSDNEELDYGGRVEAEAVKIGEI
jgi:hypothetical protein